MEFIRADKSGLFISEISDFAELKEGQLIGRIVDVMKMKCFRKSGLIMMASYLP